MKDRKHHQSEEKKILKDSHENLGNSNRDFNFGIGFKIATDFVASIFVGACIGLGFDKIFSSKPIFFFNFFNFRYCRSFFKYISYNLKFREKE